MKHLLFFLFMLSTVALFGQRYDIKRLRPSPTAPGQVIISNPAGDKWVVGAVPTFDTVYISQTDTLVVIDTVDADQVLEALEAAPDTTKAKIKRELHGYIEYVANVNQYDTLAPSVIVLKNETGGTITWARVEPGRYSITSSNNAFDSIKTAISLPRRQGITKYRHPDDATIEIICSGDDILSDDVIEIRIYD